MCKRLGEEARRTQVATENATLPGADAPGAILQRNPGVAGRLGLMAVVRIG